MAATATVPAHAADPAQEEPPWGVPLRAITPRSREVAAYLSLSPLSATNTIQLRLEYTAIAGGGHSGLGVIRTGLWMPYVLLPGVEAPDMGSLFTMDLRYQSLDLPALGDTINGTGDLTIVEVAVRRFSWGGVALGPLFIFPAATSPFLGQGKLQVGPVASFGVSAVRGLLVTVSALNPFSVAGPAERADVNTLYVVPTVGLMLPEAFYLYTDATWRFDWEREGHATIPLNLGIGRAFTSHFVVYALPEWVATGDLEGSFTGRLVLSNVGW